MKQFALSLFVTLFLLSCSSLRRAVDNDNRIILTESNLTLLNGKYENLSQIDKNPSLGNLYSDLLERGYNNEPDTGFIELKVIDKKRIKVSYIIGNRVIKSKTMRGKLKDGYFAFKRRYFFISIILSTFYKDTKYRIGLSKDNNLISDYVQISLGAAYVVIPYYEKNKQNNMIFLRINKKE